MQRIILFHARPWSLVDQVTGQPKSGLSVSYLLVSTLEPFAEPDGSEFGYAFAKESLPLDFQNCLKSVPGIYDVEFQYKPSKGKVSSSITKLEFVSEINIAPAGGKK